MQGPARTLYGGALKFYRAAMFLSVQFRFIVQYSECIKAAVSSSVLSLETAVFSMQIIFCHSDQFQKSVFSATPFAVALYSGSLPALRCAI